MLHECFSVESNMDHQSNKTVWLSTGNVEMLNNFTMQVNLALLTTVGGISTRHHNL